MKRKVLIFLFGVFLLPFLDSFAQGREDLFSPVVSRRTSSMVNWGLELSGSIGSRETTINDEESVDVLEFGIFVSRLFGVFEPYLGFSLNTIEEKYRDLSQEKQESFVVGGGFMLNFLSVQKSNTVPFLRLGLAYEMFKHVGKKFSPPFKINTVTASLGLGLKFFFSSSKKVGILLEGGYVMNFGGSAKFEEIKEDKTLDIRGLNSRLGFIVYL